MERLANKRLVWLALALCALATVGFAVVGPGFPGGSPGIVALQLAFNKETFASILRQWGPAGIRTYQTVTLWVDSWFPPAYALLLSSLIAVLAVRASGRTARLGRALFALPWLAMTLDWLENGLHLILLRNPANLSAALVLIASLAAALKWGLIAASVAGLILLVVARVRRH